MTQELNYVRCSVCRDKFPEDTMELENGKPICLVCQNFRRQPKKGIFSRLFKIFKTQDNGLS